MEKNRTIKSCTICVWRESCKVGCGGGKFMDRNKVKKSVSFTGSDGKEIVR